MKSEVELRFENLDINNFKMAFKQRKTSENNFSMLK